MNKSASINIDEEEYRKKITALKACYKEASKKTGHIFYLPILDKSVWKISRFVNGFEDTIDKSEFIASLYSFPTCTVHSDFGIRKIGDKL